MSNCLITYECEARGCYAALVGMAYSCPGVESRKAMEKARVSATMDSERPADQQ